MSSEIKAATVAERAIEPEPESEVPGSLRDAGALRFWFAVVLTGLAAGIGAALLTALLRAVQQLAWGAGEPSALTEAARAASPGRHIALLFSAGLVTGAGQWLLTRLSSGNGIDITAAIWFQAGRLPTLRTLGSALLSIVIVGMGAALGREGAPKQTGAVFGNLASSLQKLSDEQRRLMVAIGAGAGMAAVYSVPLGGAVFALEVLRGKLALRLVLPALAASMIATKTATFVVADAPLYTTPAFVISAKVYVWAIVAAPLIGLWSVGLVRAIAWADRARPSDWRRIVAPPLVFLAIGLASIPYPEVLGNGQDVAQFLFVHPLAPLPLLVLLLLRPTCTVASVACGAPGGTLHAIARSRRSGRERAWRALALDISRRRHRRLRLARRRRDARCDDAGADFEPRPDDGAYRAGAPVRPADARRNRGRDRDSAHHRNALDLRGAAQRRGGVAPVGRARAQRGNRSR